MTSQGIPQLRYGLRLRLLGTDAGTFWQDWSTQAASGGVTASGSWALEGGSSATALSGRRAETSALPTLAGSRAVIAKPVIMLGTERLQSGLSFSLITQSGAFHIQ